MTAISEDGREPEGSGPEASFAEFVETWCRMVDAVAYAKMKDPELARDVVQQTWLRAALRWNAGERPRNPGAWLLTMLRNEAVNVFRRRRVPRLVETDTPGPHTPHPMERAEEEELVRRVLDELDPEERELLLLKYVEEAPVAEMRRRLGGVAKSTIHRRAALARDKFLRIFRLRSGG